MVLQKMRAGAQGIFAKVLVGLIVLVLAVTGFGAIQFFSGGEPVAATVNGEDITQRQLDVETQRQKALQRNRLGDEIAEEVLDALVNPRVVLESLVVNALVVQFADDLGLSVSDSSVQRRIRDSFAGVEGFDDAMYRNWLAGLGHTPSSYLAEQAERMLQNQVTASLAETGFQTKRELGRSAQIVGQRRDIAYLLFDIAAFASTVEITDDAVVRHYGDFLDNYMTEERFDFDYVSIPRAPLEADVVIDEEAIELAYTDEIAAMPEPGRHAAHILLEVDGERSADDAKDLLSKVRAEIDSGASFEERARAVSEDANAEQGGDLGTVGKGVFPPAFEDALWALEPGEVSDPVETEFGVHLIKLIAVEAEDIPTLDERREDIAADLRQAEVDDRFAELLRELEELAFEEADSLEGVKDHYGVAIETVAGVTQSTRTGLFADFAIRQAAFGDEVLVDGYNGPAVATADAAVVVRLRTRHPPTERPLDEVREQIRNELALDEARQLTEEAAFNSLAEYADGATPTELAEETGLEWQRFDEAMSTEPSVPGEVLAVAFAMPVPRGEAREADVATLGNGSRALVVLSNVYLGDYGAMTEADRTALTRSLDQLVANQQVAAVVRTLRTDASVSAIDL